MSKNQKKGGFPLSRPASAIQARGKDNDEGLLALVFKCSLWGLAVWAISGIILISAACAIAYANPDPISLIPPLSLAQRLFQALQADLQRQRKSEKRLWSVDLYSAEL